MQSDPNSERTGACWVKLESEASVSCFSRDCKLQIVESRLMSAVGHSEVEWIQVLIWDENEQSKRLNRGGKTLQTGKDTPRNTRVQMRSSTSTWQRRCCWWPSKKWSSTCFMWPNTGHLWSNLLCRYRTVVYYSLSEESAVSGGIKHSSQ